MLHNSDLPNLKVTFFGNWIHDSILFFWTYLMSWRTQTNCACACTEVLGVGFSRHCSYVKWLVLQFYIF